MAFMPASRRLRRSLEKPTASGLVSGTLTLRACAAPRPTHRTRTTKSERRGVRTVKSPLEIAGQNNLSDAVPALHDRSLPCPKLSFDAFGKPGGPMINSRLGLMAGAILGVVLCTTTAFAD